MPIIDQHSYFFTGSKGKAFKLIIFATLKDCILQFQKILIIRLSSIGDIILTTPLLRSLRSAYPDAEIHYLVKKEFAALVNTNPHLDKVIEFDKGKGFSELRKMKRYLKSQQYDWIIDIHKNLRSRYLLFRNTAKYKTTYSKQIWKRTLLVWFKINRYKKIKPTLKRYFEAVEAQGISYDGRGTEVHVPRKNIEKIKTYLSGVGIAPEDPFATICPGASFDNKQWLPDRFAQAADYLVRQLGLKIVFLGGPKDKQLCDNIIALMKSSALNFAGKCTLPDSAGLLGQSKLVLTNDSGMMHLAQSQERPVVAIFGPTTAELGYFPMPRESRVLERDLPCRPCTHNGLDYCPKGHFKCMREIETKDVEEALLALSGN